MKKLFQFIFLLIAALLSMTFNPRPVIAGDAGAAGLLHGTWTIVSKPVDTAGVQCPFIPDAIEFFKDGTLVMANMPGMHMPFKAELTAEEKTAFEKRPGLKGKKLLLVKPNPRMEWTSTPMVYVYEVGKNELSLTVQGYDKALFKRK